MSGRRSTSVPRYVFDSCLFISFFANEQPTGEIVRQLLRQARNMEVEILFSFGALPEIQRSSPQTAEGDQLTQEGIDRFFEREEIQMVAVERLVSEKARAIRLQGPKGMSATDAILVATAILYGADALFTDDLDHLIKYDGIFEGLRIRKPEWSGQQSFLEE